MIRLSLILLTALIFSFSVLAQENQPPKKEFRGIWVATVINLDWPQSGNLSPSLQKSELITKLDNLKAAGINAVFFQVRTEGDALYDSDIEPWSKYVTGLEGRAPSTYWDPLQYAIEQAHKRGMELHAWINPYRAMRTIPGDFQQKQLSSEEIDESLIPFLDKKYDASNKNKISGTSERDTMHVSNKHPEWLLVLNNSIAIFNPGLPEVIEYNVKVVMDIVNRYDVDGIHFDDYFYPYPPNHMASTTANNALDDSTFAQYPRGFTNKADWRRNNVDIFVEALYDSIQVVKPWVKFGISPFGIWKNGTPSGISGMDAYSVIYGDPIAWLEAKTIDYLTPQLYWEFNRFGPYGTDYGALATWWSERTSENGLHLYPGHGLYRSDRNTFSNTLFAANEVPRQVKFNRDNENITGSVFFRTKNITNFSSQGFRDSLVTNFYRLPALTPTMAWKDMSQPNTPENLIVTRDTEKEWIFEINWDRPSDVEIVAKTNSTGHVDSLLKYAVYRVDSDISPNETAAIETSANLIALTGETSYTDNTPPSEGSYWYFVTSVSRNSIESIPTDAVDAGIVVSNEDEINFEEGFKLFQNYPNPFNPTTNIQFSLENSSEVQLKVFDVLGREVETLVNGRISQGMHTVNFDATNLSSGIYFYQLKTQSIVLTRQMMLIK